MTHQCKIAACVLVLGAAAACGTSRPAESLPSGMTPEGHCAAAARERALASDERQAARQEAYKPAVEGRVRAEHTASAERHEWYAEQHEEAALIASGSNLPPCGPFERSSY